MSEVKRCSAKRKQEVGLRLLRGERLDALSRESGMPAGDLSSWWDEFLVAGQAGLKWRSEDPRVDVLERELKRKRTKFGEMLIAKELLEYRIARHEGEAPIPKRRSNR
ncbi:hypothetical protein [Thiohalocapsa marina]|uniref:hypothetical protein n=1 Tax=Thiohalocapsa marina TaxID=424902 RepID=UPI001B883E17|nr:hypothetical protein [Thiohalocapsa marina]